MHSVFLMSEQEKPDGLMCLQSENPSQYKHDGLCVKPHGDFKVGQREHQNVQESRSAFDSDGLK